jgi:drug/metabolite transporter (DMT)-like permease
MCWAISTILFKRFPLTAAPLAVVTWQLLLGGAVVTAGMFVFEGPPRLLSLSKAGQLALVYNAASRAISQVLWFDVVQRLPTAVAGLGVLVVPSLAVVGSIVILHERPSWSMSLASY